jgi:hypothetical protein
LIAEDGWTLWFLFVSAIFFWFFLSRSATASDSEVIGLSIGVSERLPTQHIGWIRMGTTVATNALLERNSGKARSAALPAPTKVALV